MNETSWEQTDEHIHSECYLIIYFTSVYSITKLGNYQQKYVHKKTKAYSRILLIITFTFNEKGLKAFFFTAT